MIAPVLRLTIPGRPQAWQRTGGHGAHRYTRDESAAYKRLVASLARASYRGEPLTVPTRVDVTAVFARPDRCPKGVPREVWRTGERVWRPAKPDRDNVDKAILDALTVGRVLADDAVVVCGEVCTVYAAVGEMPCCEVEVWAIGWTDAARRSA